MQSNSKLTADQKEFRKVLLDEFAGAIVENGKTTIAFLNRGNTVEFALAVMSDNEKKFRTKVGEYHALSNFDNGLTVKMNKYDFYTMLADVFYIFI
jgi:hypothetical protein